MKPIKVFTDYQNNGYYFNNLLVKIKCKQSLNVGLGNLFKCIDDNSIPHYFKVVSVEYASPNAYENDCVILTQTGYYNQIEKVEEIRTLYKYNFELVTDQEEINKIKIENEYC